MATINLGNVVALLKSETPPSDKAYVVWGKILNPLEPEVVQLMVYSGEGDPAVEANWSKLSVWVEDEDGVAVHTGGMLSRRDSTINGDDVEFHLENTATLVAGALNAAGPHILKGDEFYIAGVVDAASLAGDSYPAASIAYGNTDTGAFAYALVHSDGFRAAYNDGTVSHDLYITSQGLILGSETSKLGFFGDVGVVQAEVAAQVSHTAGASYTSAEQAAINYLLARVAALEDIIVNYNLASAGV